MFTGLIEDLGKVLRLERHGSAAVLTVATKLAAAGFADGDSVAINGVCLTVTRIEGETELSFDVSPETLDASGLGRLSVGEPVNLERALRLSDRLGGHIVTGHVDCQAKIGSRREISGNQVFTFMLPREMGRLVIAKGSIAVDGISLTVNSVDSSGFTVNIIPHTASRTTLSLRKPGDLVNIETDIIGKYVERLLGEKAVTAGGLSLKSLVDSGFV